MPQLHSDFNDSNQNCTVGGRAATIFQLEDFKLVVKIIATVKEFFVMFPSLPSLVANAYIFSIKV